MAINYRESYGMFISCGILFNHESERRGEKFVTRKIARSAAKIEVPGYKPHWHWDAWIPSEIGGLLAIMFERCS